jgi:hypothetical protein
MTGLLRTTTAPRKFAAKSEPKTGTTMCPKIGFKKHVTCSCSPYRRTLMSRGYFWPVALERKAQRGIVRYAACIQHFHIGLVQNWRRGEKDRETKKKKESLQINKKQRQVSSLSGCFFFAFWTTFGFILDRFGSISKSVLINVWFHFCKFLV